MICEKYLEKKMVQNFLLFFFFFLAFYIILFYTLRYEISIYLSVA